MRTAFFLAVLFLVTPLYAQDKITKQAMEEYNEAVRAQKAANYQAADIFYQRVVLMDPFNRDWKKFAYNNRGIMFAKSGDFENAELAFKRALEMDPNYLSAKMNLGLIYEATKSKAEAMDYWFKVFEIDKLKPKDFVVEEERK